MLDFLIFVVQKINRRFKKHLKVKEFSTIISIFPRVIYAQMSIKFFSA